MSNDECRERTFDIRHSTFLMTPADFIHWLSRPNRPTLIMGVLNVTPDSFSDGGQHSTVEAAVEHAKRMVNEGADLIDIGGESTRPGADRVPAAKQVGRIVPVIRRLVRLDVAISIDTTQAPVAAAALDAGASIVNDISAGREDPSIVGLVAERNCPVILMHMQGAPATMQANPTYADVVSEVRDHLVGRANAFVSAGVDGKRIIIDPGIGFGKTVEHNLKLLEHLDTFVETGHPVLVGTSRKGFIGKILDLPEASDRLYGTGATVAWAASNGAGIVRVHDVKPMKQIVTMIQSILQAGR